jgi:hypothetical protein
MGTQVRGVHRPPLAARAQDIADGSGALPSGDPGAPTTKTRRVLVLGHYRLEHAPEFIRDPVAGRHFVHDRLPALPLLRFCCCQGTEVTTNRLFG